MTNRLKKFAGALLPASLRGWLTRHRRVRFSGPYASWADAASRCSGYDAPAILDRVAVTSRAVIAGHYAYERDSIGFLTPVADPVILATLRNATRPTGLRVLDFGGSLGSSFHQHRRHLDSELRLQWGIVEQPDFVALGKREFANPELDFFPDIPAATTAGVPDVVIMGSVLQYLENPDAVISEIARLKAPWVVITRTPFHDDGPAHRPVVQHVPPSIYAATYPAWVLARRRFQELWEQKGYALIWHPAAEGHCSAGSLGFTFETVVARRTPDNSP